MHHSRVLGNHSSVPVGSVGSSLFLRNINSSTETEVIGLLSRHQRVVVLPESIGSLSCVLLTLLVVIH